MSGQWDKENIKGNMIDKELEKKQKRRNFYEFKLCLPSRIVKTRENDCHKINQGGYLKCCKGHNHTSLVTCMKSLDLTYRYGTNPLILLIIACFIQFFFFG